LTAHQHLELVTALHGPWGVAARVVVVIVLLSASGMSASDIADLLHYEPVTVRRWIARHTRDGINGLPDRLRSGRPRLGSPRLGQRIHTLLHTPKAWTTARLRRAARRPAMNPRTFHPAVT
jgi:transposase